MYKHLLIVMLCYSGYIKAQNQSLSNEIDNYKHTITYQDHKVVFQVQLAAIEQEKIAAQKKYYWYSNNQIKVTQGGYSGKLLNGSYCDFYLNNNLKEKGRFEMGLKEGEWNTWTVQGTLFEKTNFDKGLANGMFYKYNGLGDIIENGSYKNGKLNGPLKRLIKPDSIITIHYKNGVVQIPKQYFIKRWFNKEPKSLSKQK